MPKSLTITQTQVNAVYSEPDLCTLVIEHDNEVFVYLATEHCDPADIKVMFSQREVRDLRAQFGAAGAARLLTKKARDLVRF